MPTLTFDKITKRFGDTVVVSDFHAEVPDKEFLVLLGPSGCGKSTMLRMIAGLLEISSGELRFDGMRVNELEPKQRNVAFVFQSYALYPHISVRANIAFPLVMDRFRWWHHLPVVNALHRRRVMRDPSIASRVDSIAEMMELTQYLDRRPQNLSGGQRQRVAVARALVREPTMYLLDEPLSNLDAKLRTQMRAEIIALYQRVGRTFVYVTHDQVEAMTMGTRIIVLDKGVVQQYGTPRKIYDEPANTFVARFIGSPPMNLMEVDVRDGWVEVPGAGTVQLTGAARPPGDGRVVLGVRAEKVTLEPPSSHAGLPGHVALVEHLGAETVVGFRLGHIESPSELGEAASRDLFYAKLPGDVDLAAGSACRVVLDLANASYFDPPSGLRVGQHRQPAVAGPSTSKDTEAAFHE